MEEDKPSNTVQSKKRSSIFEIAASKLSAKGQGWSNMAEKDDLECQPKLRSQRWPQYYAAFAAQIYGFALGASWYWTATALPDMVAGREFGEITTSDRAWITSVPKLGALVVCPLTGYCMSRFGRNRSMLWSAFPFAGGWLLIALAPSIPIVILGRFLIGVTSGTYAQVVPVFVAECSEVEIRGTVMCFFEIMICLGTLYIYIVGTFVSWRCQALICGLIPILGFILLTFVPESPYFLKEQDRDEEAEKALRWLRPSDNHNQIKLELEKISKCVGQTSSGVEKVGWRALKDWSIVKPMILCIGIKMCFHLTFKNAILSAVVEIFQSASSMNAYVSSILVGTTQLVALGIPMLISDKYGRRVLILVSLAFVALALISLGTYFHVKIHYGADYVAAVSWIPLASLLFYVVACSFGIIPLSFVIIGELTPSKAKGLSTSITNMVNRVVGFVVLYVFWDMLEILGQDGTYWAIAAICLLGALFIFFFVPETKGKSLYEIQMLFAKPEVTDVAKLESSN